MQQWECVFSVNGTRTQTIVSAAGPSDAKKLVEAQYPNCKISWSSCTRKN